MVGVGIFCELNLCLSFSLNNVKNSLQDHVSAQRNFPVFLETKVFLNM